MKGDIGVVVLVEDGEAVVSVLKFMSAALMDGPHVLSRPSSCGEDTNVLCVAVGSVGHFCQRRKVVQPVQAGLLCDGVDSAEEEVDIVRLP